MEKHAYAMVRAPKNFKFFVLHSHWVIYVPDPSLKSILTQQEVGFNNREVWIEKFQEYDIEIKLMKLVRGNVLYKALPEDQQFKEEDTPKFLKVSLQDPWFSNIAYFLTYGECPNGLTTKKRRDF